MMNLENKKILLTGAAGGIGSELARQLVRRGASLALLDYNAEAMGRLVDQLGAEREKVRSYSLDLLDATARERVLTQVLDELGELDLVINNAGLMSFRPFADEDPLLLERIVQLNMLVPMMVIRRLLPGMLRRGSGRIVNIGSTFGSIGFAWFAAYSASKAGLRGFSEALRRELADTGVGVTYIAPRAVRTPLNSERIMRMAEQVGMNMDRPQWVAEQVVSAIEKERPEVYLGFPESLFVRINALLPRLVDRATRSQNRQMAAFARES